MRTFEKIYTNTLKFCQKVVKSCWLIFGIWNHCKKITTFWQNLRVFVNFFKSKLKLVKVWYIIAFDFDIQIYINRKEISAEFKYLKIKCRKELRKFSTFWKFQNSFLHIIFRYLNSARDFLSFDINFNVKIKCYAVSYFYPFFF